MSDSPRRLESAAAFVGFPAFRQALTISILIATLIPDALRVAWGRPGEWAVLATLVVLAALSLAATRRDVEWRGILPFSLLALVGWVALSVFWSDYPLTSLPAAVVFSATAFLGVYIALARDLIQLVRALGDALRAILVTSLVLEVLSGIVLDTALPFLHIQGNLAEGGPIQGLAGSRSHLGFLAGLGLVTFLIEWRTLSVTRTTAIISISTAVLLVFFSGSPVTALVLTGVGIALLILWGVRRMPEGPRRRVQPAILGAALVAAGIGWAARSQIVATLGAGSDLTARLDLWHEIIELVRVRPVEGWGWIGNWSRNVFPYSTVTGAGDRLPTSAHNAYIDALIQIGVVGSAIFVIALGLGIARAWLVASEARSTVAVWPALVLLLLAATGLAESYPLVDGGLVLLVAACIAAARRRSWRRLLRDVDAT